MKSKDVYEFFGGKKLTVEILSQYLSISKRAIYKWGEIVPLKTAIKLVLFTDNKISLAPEDYKENYSKKTNKYLK